VTTVCNHYHELIGIFRRHHELYFGLFEQCHKNSVLHKPTAPYQLSWFQLMKQRAPSAEIMQARPSARPSITQLGKTREYKSKSYVPGYCNGEKTYEQAYSTKVPATPAELYQHPNINKDDRQFRATQQTVRIHQLTSDEWLKHAEQCMKSSSLLTMSHCEPMMTYIRYILKQRDLRQKNKPPEPVPSILGAKLTNDQKRELLDAFYWVHFKKEERFRSILFYYKLYGWYVRVKDGYRITKANDARQLVIKRSQLIEKGQLQLKVRPVVSSDRAKSRRGRKRKLNV